jgi:hypothetical protein
MYDLDVMMNGNQMLEQSSQNRNSHNNQQSQHDLSNPTKTRHYPMWCLDLTLQWNSAEMYNQSGKYCQ